MTIQADLANGMSIGPKNLDKAIKTAKELAAMGSANRCLVLETEMSRKDLPSDLLTQLGAWDEVWIWDAECTKAVLDQWPAHLPLPFYRGISYGGNVNHLLILAALARRLCLVRFDPGTTPLGDPADFVALHEAALSCGKIISGQYDGRIALRDDFVAALNRTQYYMLIRKCTGVDPRPDQQITGGAQLARLIRSKPDIPFDNAMTWASDDDFIRHYYPNDAFVDRVAKVGRKDPGYPQECDQYVKRLANAVVLHERHRGNSNREQVLALLADFLEALKVLVMPERTKDVASVDPATLRIETIFSGYDNYVALADAWPTVLDKAIDLLPQPEELRLR